MVNSSRVLCVMAVGATFVSAVSSAASASASARDGSVLRLMPQEFAVRPAVAAPESARVLVQKEPDMLEVRVPGSAVRRLSVPGCSLITRAAARDAFCSVVGSTSDPQLVDLATGTLQTVALPQLAATGQYIGGFEAAGTRWLAATARGAGTPEPVLVNRATGSLTHLTGQFAVGRQDQLDLDRANPVRRLCAPVVRAGRGAGNVLSVVELDGWTLQATVRGTRLQRCGSGATRSLPTGAVLGRGYVASRQGATVHVQRLKDGHVRSYKLTSTQPRRTQLMLSRTRLVVSQAVGLSTRWGITEVALG